MTIKRDSQNARKHSDANKKAIRQSLEAAKAGRSIVLDAGDNVLAGNGVAEQWEAMGKPIRVVETTGDELIAVKRTDLAPDSPEARQLATLDNLTADTSAHDYDVDRLRAALANDPVSCAIAEQDERLRALLKAPPKAETTDAGELVDRAEELQKKWQVQRGDLWQCGKHRILCGDSTNAADVARVMAGERAKLLASDPPYNVGKDYGKEVDDKKIELEYEAFSRLWFGNWQLVSDMQIVTPGCNNLARWLRYFDPYHVAPWVKTNSMTNGKVARWWCWEPVLFFGEKWSRKRPNDIFDYPIGQQKNVANHPCPKPLKMWTDLIENYGETGDIIADAFDGSGTTLIACEQTGRIGRGIEIEPKYVAVTLERLSLLGLDCQRIASAAQAE